MNRIEAASAQSGSAAAETTRIFYEHNHRCCHKSVGRIMKEVKVVFVKEAC